MTRICVPHASVVWLSSVTVTLKYQVDIHIQHWWTAQYGFECACIQHTSRRLHHRHRHHYNHSPLECSICDDIICIYWIHCIYNSLNVFRQSIHLNENSTLNLHPMENIYNYFGFSANIFKHITMLQLNDALHLQSSCYTSNYWCCCIKQPVSHIVHTQRDRCLYMPTREQILWHIYEQKIKFIGFAVLSVRCWFDSIGPILCWKQSNIYLYFYLYEVQCFMLNI